MPISFEFLGLTLFATVFLAMLLVPFASRLAHRVGAIDVPKSRSSHAAPTPRMGGLAMALSLAVAAVAYIPADAFLWGFLAGLCIVVVTGVIDDVLEVSPRWKFVGQIVAAALFVYLSGIQIERVGDLFGAGNIAMGNFSFAFTVFCIVGGMNAFNLSDGLDGLAGGLAAIGAVFFAYLSWIVKDGVLLVLAIALSGSIVGFLRHNSHPARVFMGDTGSLMLGYVSSVFVVALGQRGQGGVPLVALATVIALPLLDTLLVMGRRICYGHSPFLPDRTHLHHRLLSLGLPHPAVVAVIYAVMIGFGLLAIFLRKQPEWIQFVSLFAFGAAVFGTVSLLQRSQLRFAASSKPASATSFRSTAFANTMAGWLGRSASFVSIGLLVALLLPALFAPMLALSHNKVLALMMLALMLMFFSWSGFGANRSIFHGTLYLTIFSLLLLYKYSAVIRPSWTEMYLWVLAALALLWVLLKMYFSSHNEIVMTSAFELLMLFVSWFVPFVVLDDMKILSGIVRAIQQACLLSIPFLLLMKILVRVHERHNQWITLPLVCGLVVIGLRNLF